MTPLQDQEDFPIPADLQGFWPWAKMHALSPQTALTEDVFLSPVSEG